MKKREKSRDRSPMVDDDPVVKNLLKELKDPNPVRDDESGDTVEIKYTRKDSRTMDQNWQKQKEEAEKVKEVAAQVARKLEE